MTACAVEACRAPALSALPLCADCWGRVDERKRRLYRIAALRRVRAPRDSLAVAKHASLRHQLVADAAASHPNSQPGSRPETQPGKLRVRLLTAPTVGENP